MIIGKTWLNFLGHPHRSCKQSKWRCHKL